MRRVHGYDIFRKRQLLMKDGQYSCCMHTTKMRFLTRAALKQHLFFVHRENDASILIQHKIDKTLIKKRSWDMKGTLNEYKKAKKYIESLYYQGACALEEITKMQQLNHDYEMMEREQEIFCNHDEIQRERQTT